MDKKTKKHYNAMAALGLNMNKQQKLQVLEIAKRAVLDDEKLMEEFYHDAIERMSKNPDEFKPILDAACDLVRPLVKSEWMGFGVQCVLDSILLALRDIGWGNVRAMRLLDAAGVWMNRMSDIIMREHMEYLTIGAESADPFVSKALVDEALREMYGAEFTPWDERYKKASQATQDSCNRAYERQSEAIRSGKVQ